MDINDSYAHCVLDSLSAHVAILDRNGRILQTNLAWRKFAQANAIRMRPDTVSINYLDICRSALGDSSDQARDVYAGIRDLIEGKIDEFVIDYPCHSPTEKRWFYMRATRLDLEGEVRVVVSHENITPLKLIEDELKRKTRDLQAREAELKAQAAHLTDTNTALRVLLDQRDADRREMERRLTANLRELVLPYLYQLGQTGLNPRQSAILDIIRTQVDETLSPFLSSFSSLQSRLTPQELKVAVLVKEGRATKEIAEVLAVSMDTVDFHRKNIRKKLGLNHRKTNLRSHLLSLEG